MFRRAIKGEVIACEHEEEAMHIIGEIAAILMAGALIYVGYRMVKHLPPFDK